MTENRTYPCSMCLQQTPVVCGEETQPFGGLHIRFLLGDQMFADTDMDITTDVITCHDCSIKLLSLFPKAMRDQFYGGHQKDEVYSCTLECEYGWLV